MGQVADLQAQLEDAEASGGKGLKNQIRKLEQRILELESDLDTEGRKSAEVVKVARKADKRVKEIQFQVKENAITVRRFGTTKRIMAIEIQKSSCRTRGSCRTSFTESPTKSERSFASSN